MERSWWVRLRGGGVLQATIIHNLDRKGLNKSTKVKGIYPSWRNAYQLQATHTTLLDADMTKESFAEYDEEEGFEGEWLCGEECVVNAVS
ncbi:hypothetical protein HYFRA_00000340 [Hymenoscyphus fraxineus]|uniref:Uncharacterized protein n=1 Tax=Hymenoscyphus fraxineus TaxID=746836 RepID=A0A9N9PXT9_9HELO|nr:hypothetical protein HYFRA_00000340 [Hymenoscyphus fraxineus]